MREIPIHVPVECSDGKGGESTNVIVDPTTLTVTHVVVQDTSYPPIERLVPVEQIEATSADSIRLGCTRYELFAMEPFIETHYVKDERVDQEGAPSSLYMKPYVTAAESGYLRVDEHRIPSGQLAVHRGTRVEATDGDVGKVGELLLDPESGQISHIVLLEGHAWGEKEVVLPLSAIDHVELDTVYLKLDKQAIQALPAIPVKRAWKQVHASDIELVILAFDDTAGADRALQAMRQLSSEWKFVMLNSAVLVKDEKSNTSLKESGDVDAKHGALFGAVTGGLLGLLRGPAGAVVGAAAGAATGGVTAHLKDMGFPDSELRALQDALDPGDSALVVLLEHEWVERVLNRIADLGGEVWVQKVSDDIVARFLKET